MRFRALLQCVLSSTAASWLLLRLAHARCVLPTPRCVLCRLTALPHPPDHQPLRGNGLSHHTPSAMASRQSLLLSSTELCRTRASCLWPPYSRVRTPPIPYPPTGRLNTLHGSHTTDWSVRSMVMNTPSIICTLYHRIPYCTHNTTCTPCTRNTRTMIYAHTSDPTVSSTALTLMSRTIHQCYLYYILLLVCTLHPPHHAHATG